MKYVRRWTPEEDKILEDMWAAGNRYRRIGLVIDRTPEQIKSRRVNLGLEARTTAPAFDAWSEELDDVLRRQWAAGASLKRIAQLTGRTVRAVQHRRDRLGLPARGKRRAHHHIKVHLNKVEHERVRIRALGVNKSVSTYVRMLIMRDLG